MGNVVGQSLLDSLDSSVMNFLGILFSLVSMTRLGNAKNVVLSSVAVV